MPILIAFAFVAGLVTILSPCILPILPIVLSGTVGGGRRRPVGIILGFIGSFCFFTLFLTAIVQLTGVSATALRYLAVGVLVVFGLVLLVPALGRVFERLLSVPLNLGARRDAPSGDARPRADFLGGIAVGISMGLVWTPCVGPILASVIALALTGTVTGTGALVTLSYAVGAAIPLFAIALGGRELMNRVPWLLANTGRIQKAFGVILIATAAAVHAGLDRKLQTYVARALPSYGAGLAKIEEHPAVERALSDLASGADETVDSTSHLPDKGTAPELIPGGRWFNSPPLSLEELRGRVVLVDFWTYSCINCIRTLPYLKRWHERYKDKGLVIVGVHTPEFEFEKDAANVAEAIRAEGIAYPVMQDNDYRTWRAYANRYWPAKYLIDAEGRIRYAHFGEGDYDETEEAIQELLAKVGAETEGTPRNPAYSVEAQTPEFYLGFARMEALASPERIKRDGLARYSQPAALPPDAFAFQGAFFVSPEYAAPQPGARLELRFNAREVFLVTGSEGAPATVRVMLDGKPLPSSLSGRDVKDGAVIVKEERLYRLIKLPARAEHTIELHFPDGGVRLFAFTFG